MNVNSSCRRVMGMIFRSFQTRNPDYLLPLLKSLVFSKIDYCSVLWSNGELALLRAIEKIQADFTRRMSFPGCECPDYWERLKLLRLYSVQRRHERYVAIYMFKIRMNLVHNPGISFHESLRHGKRCDVPSLKECNKQREQSFMVRGPKIFNSLPQELREYGSLLPPTGKSERSLQDGFKRKLDDYLTNLPDEPNVSSSYSKFMGNMSMSGQMTNSIVYLST